MKMSQSHFEQLSDAIKALDTEEVRKRYRARDIPRAELVKDIDVRYRWDLYYAATHFNRELYFDGIYADAHIDTALRKIVTAL